MKLIAIEEHFLTADIGAAWASSMSGQEGTARLCACHSRSVWWSLALIHGSGQRDQEGDSVRLIGRDGALHEGQLHVSRLDGSGTRR